MEFTAQQIADMLGGVIVGDPNITVNDVSKIEDGRPHTAHTTNPVPLIWVSDDAKGKKLRDGGRLCDLAPTLLDIMHLPVPKEMTGHSLIER